MEQELKQYYKDIIFVKKFLINFKSPHTKKAYYLDLKDFLHWLEDRKISITSVNRGDLLEYRSNLINIGLKNSTINRKISSLKSFYDDLFLDNLISKNPCIKIKNLGRGITNHCSFLSSDEVKIFFQTVLEKEKNKELWLLVFGLFFYTGLRVSEILSLRMSSINKKGENWSLNVKTKGEKSREIPMNDVLLTLLLSYLEVNLNYIREDYSDYPLLFKVVFRKEGQSSMKKITYKEVYYRFQRVAYLSNIRYKRVTPHSARSTVINNLISNGVGIEKIANYVDHSDIKTTREYLRRRANEENSLIYTVSY